MNCLPFQMQNLFLIILYSICGSHRIHIQEYAYYTVWSQLFSEVHYLWQLENYCAYPFIGSEQVKCVVISTYTAY